MKIGIYSGTFDPVHLGHVAFAKEAQTQCGLAKVYFLVEPRPRRKQGVKALEHRQAMVKLAIRQEPKLGNIIISHARFSVRETLPVLQARFKGSEIAFLMGDDMLAHFTDTQWPGIDEFVKNTKLIIGIRGGEAKDIERQVKTIEKTRGIKINYETFKTEHARSNSASVRQALRKGERPETIDPTVYKYIQDNQLYLPGH